MFTLEQIKEAHSQVRSGADFPAYIQAIKQLGVSRYDAFVSDGHTDYFGADAYSIASGPRYDRLTVAPEPDPESFKADLLAHQQGQTDYPTFCADCARSGIEKWTIDLAEMTCTYFDRSGLALLTEPIPQ